MQISSEPGAEYCHHRVFPYTTAGSQPNDHWSLKLNTWSSCSCTIVVAWSWCNRYCLDSLVQRILSMSVGCLLCRRWCACVQRIRRFGFDSRWWCGWSWWVCGRMRGGLASRGLSGWGSFLRVFTTRRGNVATGCRTVTRWVLSGRSLASVLSILRLWASC